MKNNVNGARFILFRLFTFFAVQNYMHGKLIIGLFFNLP